MKPFKTELKGQNHTHHSLRHERRTENRSKKITPSQTPTTKQVGQQLRTQQRHGPGAGAAHHSRREGVGSGARAWRLCVHLTFPALLSLLTSSFFFLLASLHLLISVICSTTLLFSALICASILTLLLTAPPKLALSVNTAATSLFALLMKVLSKTGLNRNQEPHLPLNR